MPETNAVTLYVTGTVTDVMQGRPPSPDRWIALEPFLAAFEAGSPSGTETIGEFIAFNGVGYSASTAAGPDVHRLLHGSRVVSNGAVFLPRDARPAAVINIDETTPMSDVYERLHQQVPAPFCFVATATFASYHGVALSKPPIYGEAIFDHADAYYSEPPTTGSQVPVALMGCVADFDRLGGVSRQDLEKVLYDNPLDPPRQLSSHTHSLVLRAPAANVRNITREDAVAVRHLVADSLVASARFEIYEIGRMIAVTPAAD
ncbi:MAG: hypothetical protein IT178_10875 [Acidobacteria bacterium]|nr:hypothetical protein [Acidobacteriota bacterium]